MEIANSSYVLIFKQLSWYVINKTWVLWEFLKECESIFIQIHDNKGNKADKALFIYCF